MNIDLSLFPKSKKTTMLLSTFFPGTGQLYSGSTRRGLFFMILTVGLAVSLYDNYGYHHDALSDIDQSRVEYQNAKTLSEIDRTWNIYKQDVRWENRTQNLIIIYGSTLGVTWIVNMIDAFLFNGIPDE